MSKENLEFHLQGMKLAIAIPSYRELIPTDTGISLAMLTLALNQHGVEVLFMRDLANGIVGHSRNVLTAAFLESECNKMFWLDDDINFHPEDIMNLVCWSTLYPFVLATYRMKYPDKLKFPHKIVQDDEKNVTVNEHGLVSVYDVPAGCMIVDRTVFEQTKQFTRPYKVNHDDDTIYNEFFHVGLQDEKEGIPILTGEDVYFSRLWTRNLGQQIWLDPDIVLEHYGTQYYYYNPREYMKQLGYKGL